MTSKLEGILMLAAASVTVLLAVLVNQRTALGFAIACFVIAASYKLVTT